MSVKEKKTKAKPVQKSKKPKKNEVIENKGITGIGTDYNVYILSFKEKMLALIAGLALGFTASYIYFGNEALSVIVGLVAAYKAISIYRNSLLKKRKKELRLQFRDMLESLSNSYTVGMTATRAFHTALKDMAVEHGEDSYITRELALICSTHDNQGIEIKDMVSDFGVRSGVDDIRSFASVFQISSDLGGDIAKVIRETRDMISDKIETELEIQTMVTGQRNQLNVLAIMPFVMVIFGKAFESGAGTTLIMIVKLIAMFIFIFAYWLGNKIVDIKV